MRRLLAGVLAIAMACSMTACGGSQGGKSQTEAPGKSQETQQTGGSGENAEKENGAADGELATVRVGVLPIFLSSAVNYIVENKLDEQNGLKFELTTFANGSTMNEALAANLWDVGTIGGAGIFAAANYDAKIIGNHVDGTVGNDIYVRPDSPIVQAKGFNPTYPELLGNPDTVKGTTILYTAGTTLQMTGKKWVEAVGVNENDVSFVHMDFGQAYEAFLAGQGDVLCTIPPYDAMAVENGWVKVGGLDWLDTALYEMLVTSRQYYESNPDNVMRFVKTIYEANTILENDPELKAKNLQEWYKKNGKEVTGEAAMLDSQTKPYITLDTLKDVKFGANETMLAEFNASIETLTAQQVEKIKSNVTDEFISQLMK